MWIFLLQFYEFSDYNFANFSVFLWFNLFKILNFDRNNLFTHFCFFELLILKEKKVRGFFLFAIEVPKKYKFSKNIKKNTIQKSCTKKVTFLHQAPQIILYHALIFLNNANMKLCMNKNQSSLIILCDWL